MARNSPIHRINPVFLISLLLLPALASVAHGKSNKQAVLPEVFRNAHYVYVEAVDGDAMRPGLLPDDREAVIDIQNRIQEWGRYVLVYDREKADLVFILRKGRIASGSGHVSVNSEPRPVPGQGVGHPGQESDANSLGASGEIGPPDDLLSIYTVGSGASLWVRFGDARRRMA
jgi:hypothetical protein